MPIPSSSSSSKSPSAAAETSEPDPYIYAGIVSMWLTDCNPWPALKMALKSLPDTLANFIQSRRQTEQTLMLMQERLQRMQTGFSTATPKTIGQRLNKVR